MNIAAYCRVSTDKSDQLNSLETQKEFFLEYTKRTGDNLIKLYADEGISGTKIKNRKEFQRMLADAEKGLFDMVVVKDISRFARNTVDLLQSVRKLKSLGIETQFLTANMTSMGNSEFVLTIFGALAQEESANTSKRIKFGKKMNAEKGRVPNIVFEYEKQLNAELNKLHKSREKYMDMYTDDLISREELNEKIGGMRKEIERLENELKMVSYHLTKGEQLEAILNSTFKQLEDITDVHEMTNAQLKRLINKIEVDKDGNVDIYLHLIGDLGLDETVLIEGDKNTEEKGTKKVPNSYNHT